MKTLYWHDYETWGVNPAIDRPSQFAGIRTDEELNIVGEPLELYCQPPEDILPQPEACLVTGIAPQKAMAEGVPESEFIRRIMAELGKPDTCGVGYNTLRFDDEVTRYTLYRNFYDPYEREWRNGNSRWDIIDMVRACYALRPEGIEWPVVEGKPSFRLELLTAANGIGHEAAHDALSDVHATIAMARLIKQKQPALYDHIYTLKAKQRVAAMFDWQGRKPLLHVSSMFGAERGCTSLVLPLAPHPTNKNAVIVVDLAADPEDLIRLDAEQVAERVFTAQDDLPEGAKRIPLKLVHINKCPVLLTPKLLDSKAATRLNIDVAACEANWQALLAQDLREKVQTVMGNNSFTKPVDPEQQLYDGFVPNGDKALMEQLRKADEQMLASGSYTFTDRRLSQMLPRYKARNYPGALTEQEQRAWFEHCNRRLSQGEPGIQSIAELKQKLRDLEEQQELGKDKKIVLQQLYRYATDLGKKYQVGAKCGW